MLGFGKKKTDGKIEEEKKAGPAPAAAPALSEENFVIMPEKFLPKKGEGKKNTGRIVFILLFVLLFLGGLAAGLYFFLLSDSSFLQKNKNDKSQQSPPPPPLTAPPAEEQVQEEEKVVSAQAYDETNQLLGAISLTIPPAVATEFGAGIGATVLKKEDLSLPQETEVKGGIYSFYPVGVDFSQPIKVRLSLTALEGATSTPVDLAPAWLRGAAWEQAAEADFAEGGFSFSVNKFSPSPLAIIVVADEAQTGTTTAAGPIAATADADQDGLTDKEESLLTSDAQNPDTDNDSYSDKAEVLNDYSPLAPGQKLSETTLFSDFVNSVYGYKVSYPSAWLADSLDQSNKQVLFISETAEFFEILVEENPLNTPIVDWYRSQSPALQDAQLPVTIIDGRPAVWSPDGLTLYTGKDGLIYVITYNRGTLEEINWPTFYEFFYKSFRFGNTSSP